MMKGDSWPLVAISIVEGIVALLNYARQNESMVV